jgi:hypothetical protein
MSPSPRRAGAVAPVKLGAARISVRDTPTNRKDWWIGRQWGWFREGLPV